MKQYRVIERLKIFATDDMDQFMLYLHEGALILACDTCPWPFAQTTIRERIPLENLLSLEHRLEEIEVQTLKEVAKHNTINKLTFRRKL